MKRGLQLLILTIIPVCLFAQSPRGGRGGFSLSTLSKGDKQIPDSVLMKRDSSKMDKKRIIAYQLTPHIGDPYQVPLDTSKLNTANKTLTEGKGLAIGYLANLGSAAQSRIFSERKEARDFIFADAYDYYITNSLNAKFYDTKTPFTDMMYTSAGGGESKEEQFKGVLSVNFGKKINVGGDFDYIYGRGYYNSNGNKLINYRLFGSYRSDRYELNTYFRGNSYTTHENGGLTNDEVVTDPDKYADGKKQMVTMDYPVKYTNVFNKVAGKEFFLNHRYNLGFTRTLDKTDENGDNLEIFVPVSSFIHTIQYEDFHREFVAPDSYEIDALYNNGKPFNYDDNLNDQYYAWTLKNTFALSMREGFHDWAKFGLTAFVNLEKRRFQMQDGKRDYELEQGYTNSKNDFKPPFIKNSTIKTYDEFSTFLGAEIYKRRGKILTYNARGELCLVGDDIGEVRANGEIQTTFNLFKKKAYIKANAYFKNLIPAFFQRHYHSRYYWWDKDLNDIQQFYAGAEIDLASTGTNISAGVESIQNFVYFGKNGEPLQHDKNLQVVTARLKQNFYYRAIGWENELAYQISSDQDVLPLPDLCVYTNLFVKFKIAKVLSIQIGADMHYNTAYYAPYYEPATQQFQVQDEVKVGNYPLINAYVNCHLKQARFFFTAYNLSNKFIKPNHFSLAHYPLNPMIFKMGVAVRFNN